MFQHMHVSVNACLALHVYEKSNYVKILINIVEEMIMFVVCASNIF